MNPAGPPASPLQRAETKYNTPTPSSVFRRPSRSVGHPPASDPRTVPQRAALTANPWAVGERPQSSWIVCSAPLMTTVSNPNRNPARAAVRDHANRRSVIGGRGSRVGRGCSVSASH